MRVRGKVKLERFPESRPCDLELKGFPILRRGGGHALPPLVRLELRGGGFEVSLWFTPAEARAALEKWAAAIAVSEGPAEERTT
jgi:hypothetical protein